MDLPPPPPSRPPPPPKKSVPKPPDPEMEALKALAGGGAPSTVSAPPPAPPPAAPVQSAAVEGMPPPPPSKAPPPPKKSVPKAPVDPYVELTRAEEAAKATSPPPPPPAAKTPPPPPPPAAPVVASTPASSAPPAPPPAPPPPPKKAPPPPPPAKAPAAATALPKTAPPPPPPAPTKTTTTPASVPGPTPPSKLTPPPPAPSKAPPASAAPTATTSASIVTPAEAKLRATRLLQLWAPDKVSTVDALLIEYKGREKQMLSELVAKHGMEPPEQDMPAVKSAGPPSPATQAPPPPSPATTTATTSGGGGAGAGARGVETPPPPPPESAGPSTAAIATPASLATPAVLASPTTIVVPDKSSLFQLEQSLFSLNENKDRKDLASQEREEVLHLYYWLQGALERIRERRLLHQVHQYALDRSHFEVSESTYRDLTSKKEEVEFLQAVILPLQHARTAALLSAEREASRAMAEKAAHTSTQHFQKELDALQNSVKLELASTIGKGLEAKGTQGEEAAKLLLQTATAQLSAVAKAQVEIVQRQMSQLEARMETQLASMIVLQQQQEDRLGLNKTALQREMELEERDRQKSRQLLEQMQIVEKAASKERTKATAIIEQAQLFAKATQRRVVDDEEGMRGFLEEGERALRRQLGALFVSAIDGYTQLMASASIHVQALRGGSTSSTASPSSPSTPAANLRRFGAVSSPLHCQQQFLSAPTAANPHRSIAQPALTTTHGLVSASPIQYISMPPHSLHDQAAAIGRYLYLVLDYTDQATAARLGMWLAAAGYGSALPSASIAAHASSDSPRRSVAQQQRQATRAGINVSNLPQHLAHQAPSEGRYLAETLDYYDWSDLHGSLVGMSLKEMAAAFVLLDPDDPQAASRGVPASPSNTYSDVVVDEEDPSNRGLHIPPLSIGERRVLIQKVSKATLQIQMHTQQAAEVQKAAEAETLRAAAEEAERAASVKRESSEAALRFKQRQQVEDQYYYAATSNVGHRTLYDDLPYKPNSSYEYAAQTSPSPQPPEHQLAVLSSNSTPSQTVTLTALGDFIRRIVSQVFPRHDEAMSRAWERCRQADRQHSQTWNPVEGEWQEAWRYAWQLDLADQSRWEREMESARAQLAQGNAVTTDALADPVAAALNLRREHDASRSTAQTEGATQQSVPHGHRLQLLSVKIQRGIGTLLPYRSTSQLYTAGNSPVTSAYSQPIYSANSLPIARHHPKTLAALEGSPRGSSGYADASSPVGRQFRGQYGSEFMAHQAAPNTPQHPRPFTSDSNIPTPFGIRPARWSQ